MAKIKIINKPKKYQKYAKCPDCREEIDYLINVQSGFARWEMNRKGGYNRVPDFDVDNNINEWECPECQHVIAYDEESAINFLNP